MFKNDKFFEIFLNASQFSDDHSLMLLVYLKIDLKQKFRIDLSKFQGIQFIVITV